MPVRTNIISSGGGGTGTKFRMFTHPYAIYCPINIPCGSQHKVKFKVVDADKIKSSTIIEVSLEGSDEPDTTTTEYTYSIGNNPYYSGGSWKPSVDGNEIVYDLPPCKYAIIGMLKADVTRAPIEVEML